MLWKNIAREAMVGLILGVSNGIIIAIVAYLWKGNATLGHSSRYCDDYQSCF